VTTGPAVIIIVVLLAPNLSVPDGWRRPTGRFARPPRVDRDRRGPIVGDRGMHPLQPQ